MFIRILLCLTVIAIVIATSDEPAFMAKAATLGFMMMGAFLFYFRALLMRARTKAN